ncbi:hypothetical protein AALP_AAs39674U000200 [Arabis alpina]|uniref:Hydrophobic seed protein domain-containing protein n=1 Tax=Arabis alpina TaxID=50452 RepID=A0A087FWS5_ARAAL|nr:hypothetical protein AALP_AAs39674U000200 [Arabis alpina]
MASKNMTTIMALYLTFNLVLLGFTSAQPPRCTLTSDDLRVCVDVLNLLRITLSPTQGVEECCNVLRTLERPVAAVCACDIARLSLLDGLLTVRVGQLVNLCPGVTVPLGFICN